MNVRIQLYVPVQCFPYYLSHVAPTQPPSSDAIFILKSKLLKGRSPGSLNIGQYYGPMGVQNVSTPPPPYSIKPALHGFKLRLRVRPLTQPETPQHV